MNGIWMIWKSAKKSPQRESHQSMQMPKSAKLSNSPRTGFFLIQNSLFSVEHSNKAWKSPNTQKFMFVASVTRWPQTWTSLWILWQLVLLVLETFIKSQELTLLTCHEVAELFKWTRPWLAWRNLWQASIWTFKIIWNKWNSINYIV